MSDFMRIRIITKEWRFEEWDVDSIPSLSLYPLQQGKVDKPQIPTGIRRGFGGPHPLHPSGHKPQIPTGIQRQQGDKNNDEKRDNIDSEQS